MGKSRTFDRRCRLAARFRDGRLWLSPDVRREFVAATGLADSLGSAAAVASAARGYRLGGFGLSADRRAFARSIACERLADLYLLLDSPAAAFRCLEAAALAALCGEAYDHGEVSLPSRFLRIRFCRLFGRMLACRASDPRLRRLPIDRFLCSEARRADDGSL